jgi:hypothetical protein
VLALAAPLQVVNSYLIGVVLNVGHMLEQASSIDALVTIPSATTEQATPVKDVAHARVIAEEYNTCPSHRR